MAKNILILLYLFNLYLLPCRRLGTRDIETSPSVCLSSGVEVGDVGGILYLDRIHVGSFCENGPLLHLVGLSVCHV